MSNLPWASRIEDLAGIAEARTGILTQVKYSRYAHRDWRSKCPAALDLSRGRAPC